MTYGTTAQVAHELGRLPDSITPEESLQWNQWLERVERSIAARFTRAGLVLADQVALNLPDAATVADVEVAAVARKVDNPKGETSNTRTVTADDGTVSNTSRFESTKIGDDPLLLTDDEWAKLLPAPSSGAFSVRPYYEPDRCPEWWL